MLKVAMMSHPRTFSRFVRSSGHTQEVEKAVRPGAAQWYVLSQGMGGNPAYSILYYLCGGSPGLAIVDDLLHRGKANAGRRYSN